MKSPEIDVIVIGAGHAGCEAALAAARMGCNTLLLTLSLEKIALMPCNPSIGGAGKGHLVQEVNALGGEIAKNTDKSKIQIKILNRKKGPAIQALRAQADKKAYSKNMKTALEKEENLFLKESEVIKIITNGREAIGVTLLTGIKLYARTIILCGGTFLKGKIVIGDKSYSAGRVGELPSTYLSGSLKKIKIKLDRFQTATPPRIDNRTINYSKTTVQPGDNGLLSFSGDTKLLSKKQFPCHLTYTTKETREIILKYINLSPIKSGAIESHGPRFCPSIDRKVINYPEKISHPVFIEPEGVDSVEAYLQGLTTSMPPFVQQKLVQSLPGLEEAKIVRPGYAVEYDYIKPHQLTASLELKKVKNLFSAGQINGTSGYEEAAAQGIIAGINAALRAKDKEPFILGRDESYIGVMVDDLVTKGVDEPYRMFTSRVEYRLVLRADNADLRLTPKGYKLGLIDEDKMKKTRNKRKKAEEAGVLLREIKIKPSITINKKLADIKVGPLKKPSTLEELLKRPEVCWDDIKEFLPDDGVSFEKAKLFIENNIKYHGYIKRQQYQIRQFQKMEKRKIPTDINFKKLENLSFEAREKLEMIRPESVGQASRITEVKPADITNLLIYLEKKKVHKRKAK